MPQPTTPPRPFRPAPTRPVRKAAPPLSRAVDALLRPLARRHGAAEAIVKREWPAIVGPEIAALARGATLRNGVLTVKTVSGGALGLQFRASDIIERVNMHLGEDAVKRVSFLQTE